MTAKSTTRRTAAVLLAMLLPPTAAALAVRAVWRAPPPVAIASSAPIASASPVTEETPDIRGRILDGDGNPVAAAAVRLLPSGPPSRAPARVLQEATSDAAGAFSFARVDADRVEVVAEHDPEGFVSSEPFEWAGHGAAETRELVLVLSVTRGVRGTVVDEDNDPVAEASVSVEGLPWTVKGATTDEAGAFHLVIVPDPATSLLTVARGFRSTRTTLGPRDPRGELVVRIQVLPAPPIVGDVIDSDGETASAEVVACKGTPAEVRATSEDDGTFELDAAAIGCQAVAELAGSASSDPVTVVEGRRLRLRLKPGGGIEGTVVDATGSSVPGFTLGVESFIPRGGGGAGGRRGARHFEDPRGSFVWEKLSPGSYVLTASAPGMPPARSESIEVESGAVTRGVRITLAPGGKVTGRVVDDHQAPLVGVDVAFDSVSSVIASRASTKTDASGRYSLDGAPTGAFTLRAEKPGFRTRLLSGLRVASGGTLTEDVTLLAVDGGGSLELSGIGVNLSAIDGRLTMSALGPDDPAARAGLKAGDRVLAIDGEPTDGLSLADAIQRLRGELGTSVGVTVERPATHEKIDVVIVRGTIVR